MRPLSATEAISPAIEHTRALLQPFSLKLWLKLGLVACLAEAGAQFFFPPGGNHSHSSSSSGIGSVSGAMTSATIGVFVVIAIIGILIGLALFYLAARMQLVMMDIVATRTTLVAPVWNRTAPRTWRWIGLKIGVFLALCLVVGVFFILPIFFLFYSARPAHTSSSSGAFVGGFAFFLLIALTVVFLIVLVVWAMRDFVLPFLLFEDASMGESIQRAVALMRREPGSVAFYLIMKFLLCLVAGIAAEFAILLSLLILCLPLGGIAAALWFLLRHTGPFGTAVMYISFVLLGLILVAAFIGAILCILCAVLTFYQAYTLYFLGGRIPVIGNLLEPPPMQPPPMPPPLIQPPDIPPIPAPS
jgi:hypothetical protein